MNTPSFSQPGGLASVALDLSCHELAKRLSHELRNPLAPIAMAAELLVRHSEDEQVRRLGRLIEHHAAQLHARLDELIAAAGAGLAGQSAPGHAAVAAVAPAPTASREAPPPSVLAPAPTAGMPNPESVDERLDRLDRPDRSGSGLRILVVDDNADAAHLLGLFLQSLGHEVRVLSDPLLAAAVALEFQPEIGLLDIAMPGLDGHGLARQLLQLPGTADLQLAAVTAYGQACERRAAADAGFSQYFVKPVDVCELQDWLGQASVAPAP